MTDLQDYSQNIKSYEISYDLFNGAGSFNASLDARIEMNLAQKALKFMWKINGIIMMTGYIDKKEFSYSKGSLTQTITGRDMMQVLLDNYVLSIQPYEQDAVHPAGWTLKEIIDDVWEKSRAVKEITTINSQGLVKRVLTTPVSIPTVTFSYTTEALNLVNTIKNFKHIKTSHDQTLFDFISNLCNQIGLFLFNVPGTNEILIHAVTSPNAALMSYNREGLLSDDPAYQFSNSVKNPGSNNIINCTFSENITNFHKYHKLVGQAQQDDSIAGTYYKNIYGKTQGQLKIEKFEHVPEGDTPITAADLNRGYTGLMKFKVANVNECDLKAWVDTRDLVINNLLLQQNRKLYNIKFTVANHSPENTSSPFFINHVATVYDDFLGIGGSQFLVYAVAYKGSKDGGLVTDVTLCLPGTDVPGLLEGVKSGIMFLEGVL
jgi:hypothetical protein